MQVSKRRHALKLLLVTVVVLSVLSLLARWRSAHDILITVTLPVPSTIGSSQTSLSSSAETQVPERRKGIHIGETERRGKETKKVPRPSPTRKPGRDGVDHSHLGMQRDETDGMMHAWAQEDPHRCFGAEARIDCVDAAAVEWFRENVLLSIVTGAEGAFRVEVSQCTWLSHFPVENVFVLSDLVPVEGRNFTPHTWVKGTLPRGVYEDHGDIFSPHVKEGYVKIVRKRGQGYSASWIIAQFRFAQAIEHLQSVARLRSSTRSYKWFMIIDDDTIVQLPNLVKRLKQIDGSRPYYLSRKGWGGAGHVYSATAFKQLMEALPQCVESYFVKSFRASDDMLLKCAHRAHLHCQLEETMSHCPASHVGPSNLLSLTQATFHGKKDFYPPVLLTTWRVSLYYFASYCKSLKAAESAAYYSACAFGSCKQHGCTKEKNEAMIAKWRKLSRNNTITLLPFDDLLQPPSSGA